MATTRIRLAVLVTGLVCCLGCGTFGGDTIISHLYYYYGPEDTLETLETSEINPENLALADLEKAMVLLELGRYEESLSALRSADFRFEASRSTSVSGLSRGGYPPWQPEYHERILASTVAMADSLALYDVVGAATAADRAVAGIAEIGCEECEFDFTRILAALSYGGAGRFTDGIEVVSGVVVTGQGEALINEIRRRLELGTPGVQPEGLAPPPVESERFVVAILLLGGGPYKDVAKLEVAPDETIRWCRYVPRDIQAVEWAAMDLEDPAISVEYTDVEELAVSSLALRAQRVIAGEEVPVSPEKRDLRHWTSLPASLQLLVVDLPPETDVADLVYYSSDGYEIDREPIEVPSGWWGGPIFVTRRIP